MMNIKNKEIKDGKEITEFVSGHKIEIPDQTNAKKNQIFISAIAFYERFTSDEIIGILGSDAAYAKKLILEMQIKRQMDLKSNDLLNILTELEDLGILAENRSIEITT